MAGPGIAQVSRALDALFGGAFTDAAMLAVSRELFPLLTAHQIGAAGALLALPKLKPLIIVVEDTEQIVDSGAVRRAGQAVGSLKVFLVMSWRNNAWLPAGSCLAHAGADRPQRRDRAHRAQGVHHRRGGRLRVRRCAELRGWWCCCCWCCCSCWGWCCRGCSSAAAAVTTTAAAAAA